MNTSLRSVFTPVRATAPDSIDQHWRAAYAICRTLDGRACPCEYNLIEPCPERLRAAIEASKVYLGER